MTQARSIVSFLVLRLEFEELCSFFFFSQIINSEDNGSWEGPMAIFVTDEKSLPGAEASAEMSKNV